jgi:hypothetical protein
MAMFWASTKVTNYSADSGKVDGLKLPKFGAQYFNYGQTRAFYTYPDL